MTDYEMVRRAVADAGAETPADRSVVYRRLEEKLRLQIAEVPPKLRRGLAHRTRELRAATVAFERDAKAGKLRPEPSPAPMASVDPAVSTISNAAPAAPRLSRLRSPVALMFRYLVVLSRVGPASTFWLFAEPLLQISLIVGVYALIGRSEILDMPALPFAVIGISAFVMFRMILMRVAMPLPEPSLFLIPRIRTVDLMVGRTLGSMAIYTGALIVVLLVLRLFGVQETVDRPLEFAVAWLLVGFLAFGLGITLRGLIAYAPFIQRGVPWMSRLLFWTSGVMFVSEQLPDFIARPLLFNPLMHIVQSLRSAFFVSYDSYEVSLLYGSVFAMVLTAFGLALLASRLSQWK